MRGPEVCQGRPILAFECDAGIHALWWMRFGQPVSAGLQILGSRFGGSAVGTHGRHDRHAARAARWLALRVVRRLAVAIVVT